MNLNYDPMLNWVANRIRKNKNCIIMINGGTGSGKTYAGIKFCQDIAKKLKTNFSIQNNMDFKFSELLKKMELEENSKPGTPFLFEEVGAVGGGASARQWQSKANRFFHSFMQTSRHRRQILIMTCPSFSYLEKGARELCHTQWEMQSIDHKAKVSKAKTFILQVNRRTGHIYFKHLRFVTPQGGYRLRHMLFEKPDKQILEDYEELKLKYTKKLNQDIIDNEEEKKNPKKKEHKHTWNMNWKKGIKACKHCDTIEEIDSKSLKIWQNSQKNVKIDTSERNKPPLTLVLHPPRGEQLTI